MTKNILIYDVSALPRGKRMKDIEEEFNRCGVVMWASKATDNMSMRDISVAPTVVSRKKLEAAEGIKFVDVSEEKK